MCGCESWTIKKAEHQRIKAFELWCWEKTLESPLDRKEIQPVCPQGNQSILKETSPEYSLEGLMLKPKLQYFGHLMLRTDSLEKTLRLGKIEGRRGRGKQRMRWLGGITNSMDMSLSKLRELVWTGRPGVLQSIGSQRVGHDWTTELNWADPALLWSPRESRRNLTEKNSSFWDLCTSGYSRGQTGVEWQGLDYCL